MTNIFQCTYDQILKKWYELRKELEDKDLQTICTEVDNWWQKTPQVNHYLHGDFVDNWPDPWELIYDNHYCPIARGLGMIYTLHLLGVKDVALVEARDYNNEDVVLVLVEGAKYILNYWPNTVLNNSLQDFTITKTIKIEKLLKKVQ